MSLGYVSNTLKSKFGIELDRYKGFPTAPWAPPVKVETRCVKCGSNNDVWCTFSDFVGGVYYYCHACLDCGHVSSTSEYHGGPPVDTAMYFHSLPESVLSAAGHGELHPHQDFHGI